MSDSASPAWDDDFSHSEEAEEPFESRIQAMKREMDRELDAAIAERGLEPHLNAGAYGPDAIVLGAGEIAVVVPRPPKDPYLGDTTEHLMEQPRDGGKHGGSSSSRRIGVDPKRQKLKKSTGRPWIDDEPRNVAAATRITESARRSIEDHGLSYADILCAVAKALDRGVTFAQVLAQDAEAS